MIKVWQLSITTAGAFPVFYFQCAWYRFICKSLVPVLVRVVGPVVPVFHFSSVVWVLCIRCSISLMQCGSCVFGVPFLFAVWVLCIHCPICFMQCRSCVFGVLLPLCSVGPVFPVFHFAYAVWVHLRTLCITLNNVEPSSQVLLYSSQGKTWVPHMNNQHWN